MNFVAVFRFMIAFLPAPVQALLLAIVAVWAIYVVFKLIALVLDAIPFL